MDIVARLIICLVLGVFYAPGSAFAYEYIPKWENLRVIDGELHIQRPGGGTTLAYPDAGISKEIPVTTSKGGFPVPVQKSFPVVPAKVGKAAIRFVKTLPAIGTAVLIYDTVCDLTDICVNKTGSPPVFEQIDKSEETKYKTVTGGEWDPSGLAPGQSSGWSPSFSHAYDRTRCGSSGKSSFPESQSRFNSISDVPGGNFFIYYDFRLNSSASWSLKSCSVQHRGSYAFSPPPSRQVVESDWTAAETKLSANPRQVVESLYNSGGPVPVDASTHSSPVTKQISETSAQTKDALGNVTGTQVQKTDVKVQDTSTAGNVTYNITEITTTTTYNEDNQVTGTQTSTSDVEPPKSSENADISFDNVPDAQLDTEDVNVQLDPPVSWGEGTCPPDETLTLQGRSYSISYQPACAAATELRPIFVLLASVSALFIVAGVSRSRGE